MARSRQLIVGLTICAALGALDIVGLAGFATHPTPPAPVMIIGALLGLTTLVAVRLAWRDSRAGVTTVAASRLVSGLLGIGVFLAPDAPGWAQIVVAVAMALTVVGLLLIYPALRQAPRSTTAQAPVGAMR